MRLLNRILSFFRGLTHRADDDRDLDAEVRAHAEMLADEKMRQGMTAQEAARAARIEIGGIEQVKEEVRSVRPGVWLETLWRDVRFGLRLLRKSPGFTVVAILTLALGIGANTAIFSVVNSALLRPLAYSDPQQLYLVREIVPQLAKFYPTLRANIPDFRIWQQKVHSFQDVAIAEATSAVLTGGGEAQAIFGVRASANIFALLGARPAIGRAFLPEEDEPGRGNVVILTDGFWRSRFGADPYVLGKTLTLNGAPYEIVGVLPATFRFPPALGGASSHSQDFFEPLNGPRSYEQDLIGEFDFTAVARLRPGVTSVQALAELNIVQAQIAKQADGDVDLQGTLQPLEEEVVGPGRRGLIFLLGAVGAILLIVCANLAGLLLARVPGRMREAGVRIALGASRARILRQMLTESLLLTVAGGAFGVWIAGLAVNWLVRVAPANIPRLDEVHIDARVLVFAVVVSIATGALFGILPAWRIARAQPIDVLKSAAASISESRRTRRLREGLVSLEVGLTTALLILSGLLTASLVHLLRVNAGFATENVLVAGIDPPPQSYYDPAVRLAFYNRVLVALQTLPGTRAAGWVSVPPLGGEGSVTGINIPGAEQPKAETPIANYRPVSLDYFSAMGIPLLHGRVFNEADSGRKIVVVSQSVADRFWPGRNPVGQICITQWGPDTPAEVVGVVGDIRTVCLDEAPLLMVYVPHWFNTISIPSSATFILRTSFDPIGSATSVRNLIHKLDPDVPITTLRPMSQIVSQSVDARRFQMSLAMSFALSSLLLASLGIFGVVGYSVEQRRHELGIRMALGADLSDLLAMVLRQGMLPVVIGLAGGLVGAILAGRLIASLLFGVTPYDPLTLAIIVLAVTSVALLACYIPARRATRVDPMVALRYE